MSRPSDWWVLDLGSDPTPGDPVTVRSMAASWGGLADDAEYAEGKLRALIGDEAIGKWVGEAGDAFRDKTGDLPGQLGKCKNSYRQASEALSWWAGRLEVHQGDADRALVKGRAARADLEAAQAAASVASGGVESAAGSSVLATARKYADSPAPAGVQLPSESQVRAAQQRLSSAQAASRAADAAVVAAQSRLDAARQLALDASSLRVADAKTAAGRIREASDAGIPERSRWEKFKDWAAEAWDVIIKIAKIVVAVLGIVALIIGGPLAWVVFAAALLVLADTIMKYMKGQASLWDVLFAALDCIPGAKGLTTLKALKEAFAAKGLLGAVAHLGGAIKTAGKALVRSADRLRVGGLPAVSTVLRNVGGAEDWAGLRAAFGSAGEAFNKTLDARWIEHIAEVGKTNPARAARLWQGSGSYPGVDKYWNVELPGVGSGNPAHLEAGWPGLSGYAVPEGTAASVGNDASAFWEGAQVGPLSDTKFDPYRGQVVTIEVQNPITVAQGHALANPQYGTGGTLQHFIPDINSQLASGNLAILDAGGSPIHIPQGTDPGDVAGIINDHFGSSGAPIHLTDPTPRDGIPYLSDVASATNARPNPWAGLSKLTGYTWTMGQVDD